MTAEGVEEEEQLAVLKGPGMPVLWAFSSAYAPPRRWGVSGRCPARLNM